MTHALWATPIGKPAIEESLITETESMDRLELAKKWAIANGFDRLRVVVDDGVIDFESTISV